MASRTGRRPRGTALSPLPAGSLLLVSTPIGNLEDLSPRGAAALSSADLVCCEDTRHTGKLFAHLGVPAPPLRSLHAHNEASRVAEVLEALSAGQVVVLCSDAGTPLVSDPGARLLAAALEAGVQVSAVPGPAALLDALVLSGFSGRFTFEGFLARKGPERKARLAAIARAEETSILYEAPGRVAATLGELETHCGPERRVAICRELTKLYEEVFRGTLAEALEAKLVREPRGEYVVVVGPAEAAPVEGADLTASLQALRASGMSIRDAVRAVEVLQEVGHREAYAAALALEREAVAPEGP